MKQKWGRPDDAGDFPNHKAAWTIGAFCVALLSVFAIGYYCYMRVWTPLQQHYLTAYVGTSVAGAFRTDGWYTLLIVVTRQGARLALDNEVEPFVTEKAESTFTLTEAAMKTGDLKLEWQRARYDNAKLHEFLSHWIYQDQTLTDLAKPALWGGLGVLLVGLVVAIPKDAARRTIRKHGRRLKGPELVTARAFNRRNRSDGIGFLQQQTLYREAERAFSEGDRVQFTAPNRERHIANRELGTVEKIDDSGNLQLRLDSGREVAFNIKENPHLDYGYAVTSHSSQGQTADRVLVHVDTEQAGEKLVNRRLAYVAVSRGRYDAQIYTNDTAQLAEGLGRDVSHRSAMEPSRESVSAHKIEPSSARSPVYGHTQAEGHSISR